MTASLSPLHNLILTEVFHAHSEALTLTEIFHQTNKKWMDGQFTTTGLLEFTCAVVRLEEEGLLEPVSPQGSTEGHAGNNGRRSIEPDIEQDAAGGGCAPQIKNACSPQITDGGDQVASELQSAHIDVSLSREPQPGPTALHRNLFTSRCASQQLKERSTRSAITAKGEIYLFSQLLLGLLPDEALGKLAKSGTANGAALAVEPTARYAAAPTSGPAAEHCSHAPAGPEGNGGGAAPKLTSPLSATGSDTQSASPQKRAEDASSFMEQLFPDVFCAAKRQLVEEQMRVEEQMEDTCHCGELAHRTCPCGARTCHNHFYDGEGNLARRDHAGFCGECIDLIREEAAGIERCGRTQ